MNILFKKYNKISFVFLLLFFINCSKSEILNVVKPVDNKISLNHFNQLYKEIDFKGKKAAMVYIYSDFPNYLPVLAPGEGIACVDDVSRAIILLSEYIDVYGSTPELIDKIKKMTEFVLNMQNENGYFNNFIFGDLSVNTTYTTSIATLDWWSLRALSGLEYAYPILKSDADLKLRIEQSTSKLLLNIKRDLPITNLQTEIINGIEMPTWLPQEYASDQSALLILGLLKNYERTNDLNDKTMIEAMAQGIMVLQKGDGDSYPYGAFMSYKNLWHAYGNDQAYALLKAGIAFNNEIYINSALKEINGFYPKLINKGYAEAFSIQAIGNNFSEISNIKFPQIAYGIRPMVSATATAYKYSNNPAQLNMSKTLAAWLTGSNAANSPMYEASSGVFYDGIVSSSEINRNSGAESTIEGLLILLTLEKLK
ncbi:MAG: hypothetical protein H7250_01605 [Flavobacterium sp.]|nr:hypothetical protein [Flavobacterium sp.]